MMNPKSIPSNEERALRSGAASPQREAALNNLRKLDEAVERFGKQVKDGSIAPPGRWK